jgi:hypothetical protein
MGVPAPDADDVHQSRACVANGLENLAQASFGGFLDDDAGCWGDVGFQVGIGPAGVAAQHVQMSVVELAGERLALDQEFDLEAGHQCFIEHPEEQLGLTNGDAPHSI